MQVMKSLQMFHTYNEAFGPKAYTLDGWQTFLKCDLSVEVLRLAKSQSINAALTIWSRHKVILDTQYESGIKLSLPYSHNMDCVKK